MESNDIFVRTLLTDKVKLRPHQLTGKLRDNILDILKKKFEGVCSYHGYIRHNSIELFKYSLGTIQALSLNGDVEYLANYYADVCNPSIGSVVHTKVVNMNKFGLLAHTGIRDVVTQKFTPILEIVVAKNMVNAQNEKNTEEFSVGDEIHVEILGKKFELTDKKISAVARIITTTDDKNILDAAEADVEAVGETDDEEDDETNDGTSSSEDEEDEEEDGDDEEADEEEEDVDNEDEDEEDEDANSQLGGDLGSEGFFSEDDDAISDFMSDTSDSE